MNDGSVAAHQAGLLAAREEFGVDEEPVRGAITSSHPGGRRQRSAAWGHKLADVEFVQLRAAEARTEWTVDWRP